MHEELTKSMTTILKPSADFLTSNKLLKVRREGQCGSAVGKLKKLQTSWPDPFHPLCTFEDSQQLLQVGNRDNSSVATLLFMLVLQREPQGITTLRVSQSYSDQWQTLS